MTKEITKPNCEQCIFYTPGRKDVASEYCYEGECTIVMCDSMRDWLIYINGELDTKSI